jgi:predicted ribosome quality control (RQC) complex YloA/Tae2 family protein
MATKEELEALREGAARALAVRRKRLERKREAIAKDVSRVAEAEEEARLAALAVPTAARIPRGARSVSVVDYASGSATSRDVALDPTKPARESLERIFQRARRLRRGERIMASRLEEVSAAINALDDTLARLAQAEDVLAIEALVAARTARNGARVGTRKPAQERKPPYRTFRTPRGDIWVGRGAAKNDELTFRVAKPYHLWLHVRGTPGAHVVIPLARQRDATSELLVDAAHLAAHFSDARGERTVEVSYVQRKFVRKPKGSGPGLVTMEREKVLALRVEAARVEHLLSLEADQNE